MGTAGDVDGVDQSSANRPTAPPNGHAEAIRERWIMAAAIVAPVAAALLLIPWREHLDTADNALILVVVIVAVASTGRRLAAALSALASALAFDFFLTRPYYSLRITRTSDLITEVLLLVVGLAVGELAARGRGHRRAAIQGRDQVALLHSVTEMAATGRGPMEIANAASRELEQLLSLIQCRFTTRSDTGVTAQMQPDGRVLVGDILWATSDLGLPTHGVDLPVRGHGQVVGHFIATPIVGVPIPHESLLVAVAIADQVGSAMVTEAARSDA